MLQQFTQQQIDARLEKLPEVLKDALYSADIAEKMYVLGKKFGLSDEKIGFMAEETGYVILGLTPPREFVPALQEALGLDAEKTRELAREINRQIFYPLREELKKTHQIEITEEEIEKAEPLIRRPLTDADRPPAEDRGQPRTVKTPPAPAPKPAVGIVLPPPKPPAAEEEIRPGPPLKKEGTAPPAPPPPQKGEEKPREGVIQIPKLPQREPLIPPELATSPKIPPINLRIKNQESRIRGLKETPSSAPPLNQQATTPRPAKPTAPPPSQSTAVPKIEPRTPAVPSKPATPPPSIPINGNQESRSMNQRVAPPKETSSEIKPTAEKKTPYGGFDPYREPAE